MRRPFVYITIPMLMGIIFSYIFQTNTYLILVLFLGFLLGSLILVKRNRSISLPLLILFFLLGILLMNIKSNGSQLIDYKDKTVEIRGMVEEVGNSIEGQASYIVSVDQVEYEDRLRPVREKLSLKVLGGQELELGDRIRARGVLREPLGNTNPRLYNHKLNLLTKGIYTSMTVKDYGLNLLEGEKLSLGIGVRKAFTDRLEDVFDNYLEEDNSLLMKSIVLGKSSYLDEGRAEDFRDLGLAHILAVSGLHIGVIAGFLLVLFGLMSITRDINILSVITILWLYAYMIGNPPSVIRANIMFTLLLIGRAKAEPYDSINALFLALFIMGLINPFSIFSIGLQLSFVATFSIIYLTPRIRAIFYPYKSSLINSIAGILAVQIGLLPIQAYYFNRFPLLALVSNLVLIPLFSLALILGVLLIPFSFLGLIGESIGIIIDSILDFQLYIMDIFKGLELILKLPSPSIVGIFVYYTFIGSLLLIIDIRALDRKILKVVVYYLLILILINSIGLNLNKDLEISFIDVGQGDCILLTSRNGNYLIDTGGSIFGDFDIGKNIVLPYLEKRGIFKLEGVFISHFHGDHCKSLPYLMDNMDIEHIYLAYRREGNEFYDNIVESGLEKNIPIRLLKKGDSIGLYDNSYISLVGPDKELLDNPSNDDNDLSMVLLLRHGNQSILFTGDIEGLGEDRLREGLNTRVDFLKVPHHGSNTSSSENLLDGLDPKAAFISVGRNNSFGHPREEVLARYRDRGIDLYRTDEMGLISLHINGEDYKITPFIKEQLSISYILEAHGFAIIYSILYIIISYIMISYYILQEEDQGFEL